MKIAGALLLFLILAPGYAAAYIIDFSGTMWTQNTLWGDAEPTLPQYVPFKVAGDTALRNFTTMSIWIDDTELTAEALGAKHPGKWRYHELNFWEAHQSFAWIFHSGGLKYELVWQWTEINGTPDQNPIKQFTNIVEWSWWFDVSDEQSYAMHGAGLTGPIVATPRQVSEPATLFLLALSLTAIWIRQRLR